MTLGTKTGSRPAARARRKFSSTDGTDPPRAHSSAMQTGRKSSACSQFEFARRNEALFNAQMARGTPTVPIGVGPADGASVDHRRRVMLEGIFRNQPVPSDCTAYADSYYRAVDALADKIGGAGRGAQPTIEQVLYTRVPHGDGRPEMRMPPGNTLPLVDTRRAVAQNVKLQLADENEAQTARLRKQMGSRS